VAAPPRRRPYVYLEVPADREFMRLVAKEHAADPDAYWQWVIDQGTLTVREVKRDDSYIDEMVEAERGFWQSVEADETPDPWLPDGEIVVDDEGLADLLDDYGQAHADGDEATKEDAKQQIKNRAQAIAAGREGVKKIHIADTDDYVLWHGSGYWVAKPADREPSGLREDTDVPF